MKRKMPSQGMITDPKKPCEMCVCLPNGTVKCAPKICPKPRCGLDLQKPSSDGCCVMCDPKCYTKPCSHHLPCPVSKQVYRNGSCCPECSTGCEYGGSRVPVGMIANPKTPCEMCVCLPNGTVKCVPKVCRKPRCGLDLQKPSSDGCCVICDPKCYIKPCTPHLPCPVTKHVYRNGSCCPECNNGCEYDGSIVPIGSFDNPKNSCEICRCLNDGSVTCEHKKCEKPQCALDLQEMSKDGCCLTCHPKCQAEYPCKPKCPAVNLVSRDGFCCPQCICRFEGSVIPVGPLNHPKKPCEICKCLDDGSVKCEPKPCEKPLCGLDLQEKSKDGCCVTCHPKCQAEYPCNTKLPCSSSNQMSINGSCCPECVCKYEGTIVPVGILATDPNKPCQVCECLENGKVKCSPKTCGKPKCGIGYHVKSDDGCCTVCDRRCEGEVLRREPDCPISNQFYRDNSCLPECGCYYKGYLVPLGPCGHRCDKCECRNDTYQVTCDRPACPKKKLECVDPVYDSKCKLVCPFGRTCLYKNKVIKPGQYLKVGKRICTCLSDHFYPELFCAMKKLSKNVKELQKSKCVAKPENLLSKKKNPF